jgi:hypothetical protein
MMAGFPIWTINRSPNLNSNTALNTVKKIVIEIFLPIKVFLANPAKLKGCADVVNGSGGHLNCQHRTY